jgi:hypothetical protein
MPEESVMGWLHDRDEWFSCPLLPKKIVGLLEISEERVPRGRLELDGRLLFRGKTEV